jgi:hypothetical protein
MPGQATPSQPWDKQPGEPEKAWAAFLVYRELGTARTLADTQKIVNPTSTGNSGNIGRTATRWQWRRRAAAWDAFLLSERAEAKRAAGVAMAAAEGIDEVEQTWRARRRAMRDNTYELADALISKAREMLSVAIIRRRVIQPDPTLGRPETIVYEPAKWNFRTIKEYVETADRLKRMACEMPATIADIEVTHKGQTIAQQGLFAVSSGVLDSVMPPGSVPEMPANVVTRPKLRLDREAEAAGLTQPPTRPRPERRPD